MNKERIYQVVIGALIVAFVVFLFLTYDISVSKKGKGNRSTKGDSDIAVTKEEPTTDFGSKLGAVPRITAKELNDKLNDSDVIVLDVRDIGHWVAATEKIKGAVREDPTKFESWYKKYSKDKEKTIVTYCD